MAHRKLLTALLTLGCLLSSFAAASATTPPSKSLEIASEPGDFVGQGLEYSFSGSDATFEAFQSFGTQVRLRVLPRDGGFWVLHFGAPSGQRLVPGTYEGALRSNTFNPESPTLDIGGNGRGCNQSFGSFVVNDARFDGLFGDVIGFDASFEFHCERIDAPALRGHIHYTVDSTPPVLVATVDPAPNADGWNTTSVVVTWTVSDPESGIAWEDCAPTTISHETFAHAAFCRAQNGDGRISMSHIAVHIDKTGPSISTDRTPAANAAGWNNSDVTVNVFCSDALSGVVSCEGSQTLIDEGAGQSVTATATDRAGNVASVTVGEINIDRTAPVVTFSGSAGSYRVDQIIDITCSADDSLSGIAASSCPATHGLAANYVGATASTTITLTATAIDNAGNSAVADTAFTVTVTADGICGLTTELEAERPICALATAIANATNAQARAGALSGLDRYLAAQSGQSISAERAQLLSRLAHLL